MNEHPLDRVFDKPRVQDGQQVAMFKSGDRYVLENVHDTRQGQAATLRRAVPKVRGKAARKADKLARRTNRWL